MLDALPRITVVTPSFNQVRFLERTICSVLDQGYDNLEYIVVDGGSCDGSTDVIKRYQKHLTWWVSTHDGGQAEAINKAMRHATGDIFAYLASDDLYMPFALDRVAERFSRDEGVEWLVGGCMRIDEDDRVLAKPAHRKPEDLADYMMHPKYILPQQASFWRSGVFERMGVFEDMLHYQFDFEFMCRLLGMGIEPVVEGEVLAARRLHGMSASARDRVGAYDERMRVMEMYTQRAEDALAAMSGGRKVVVRRHAA